MMCFAPPFFGVGRTRGLGTGGTMAVGVVLLVLILGWAAMRIIHRPERTVWLPVKP